MFDALRGITYGAGYKAGRKDAIDGLNKGPFPMVPLDPKPAKQMWDEILGDAGYSEAAGGSEGMAFLRDYIFGPSWGTGIGIGLENDIGTTPEDVLTQYLEMRRLPADTDIRLALMMIIKEVHESLDVVLDFMGQLVTDISDVDQ